MDSICEICGTKVPLSVNGYSEGFCLVYACPTCGLRDRHSGFYSKHSEAEEALNGEYDMLRTLRV